MGERCVGEGSELISWTHGIFGNVLALEGERREHFLALAIPQSKWRGVDLGGDFEGL